MNRVYKRAFIALEFQRNAWPKDWSPDITISVIAKL